MGPRCSSAETQVCHRSYIIAARILRMSSEKNSELSEYSNDLGKKFGIVRILRIDLGKKFGIVRILRMTSEKNSELSELTSKKNSEFRIKVGNYHPYSENIVRFGNYSKLALRKFTH